MKERLQKLISAAGLASRRHAEEMILAGQVTVNGEVITSLGSQADPEVDHIKVRGRLLNPLLQNREFAYVLLNKPRGYLTSLSDDRKRPLVTDLIPETLGRLHPVGRLDFNTEGLLILTNDGELTNIVTKASSQIGKVYLVKVKGAPAEEAVERLRRGVKLSDGVRTAPARIKRITETETNSWFEVTLHEGRNQQIRRMFDQIGHSVLKLRRVAIGPVKDDNLALGRWRPLSTKEVSLLKRPAKKTAKTRAASQKN
jgi:23S rRNA pseudouridine2605 synthase